MGHFLNPEVFLLAVAFDLLIGDPKWLIHPTQMMGYLIAGLEKLLRRFTSTPARELWAGGLLVGIVVLAVYLVTLVFVWFSHRLNYWLDVVVSAWLLSTTFAIKGLAQAGLDIFRVLQSGDLLTARKNLSYIVGRDTEHLSSTEVVRATVETVAENIVDGVISPLFYAILGGIPFAFVYRAINTMDSMLGYKNERYLYFGRVAARADDVTNYIPARVTAGLLLLAAKICGLNWRKALYHLKTDAKKHPSPNSGLPEAAVAGALGVSLGGLNFYGGIPSPRAILGEAIYELKPKHILEVVRLLYCTSALGILLGLAILLL